jgi:dihydroflavonol-4-reductase
MGQVLITGGAGFLGQHVVRELLADGARVRALSRRPETDTTLAALGAEPVRGDVTDLQSLRAAMRGVDTVFHTAADTNTWRPNNAAQTRTNVGGASNLVEAAREAGVRAFIHTSSVSAYSHLVHTPLREDTVQRGGESWVNYERTKFQAEHIVRGSGLPFVILQPAHIFGPGDTHNWSRLVGLVQRGELPGVPPGNGSFADVREIARAQVHAWRQQRFGEAYLLGGEQASFLEVIAMIGAILGKPVPKRATPEFALRLVARLMYAKSLLTRRAPQITPEAAEFTCHKLSVDSSKAKRELGYRLTPLRALLEDTIAWMRSEKMLG